MEITLVTTRNQEVNTLAVQLPGLLPSTSQEPVRCPTDALFRFLAGISR